MAHLIANSSLLFQIFTIIHCFSFTESFVDITSFGAKPNAQTDSSKSFIDAWNVACQSSSSATIYVPSGSFLLGPITFAGPCKSSHIILQLEGTLVSPSSCNAFANKANWILFEDVHSVSIYGGVIDGRGASLWSCKTDGDNCPDGATSLTFANSKNIMISGLTSINSELYHIVIDGSESVTVQGVKISAPGNSPNTDGIHIEMSTDVIVSRTQIKTGDDCISIGPGTTNLWIEQVSCGPGHGISIGSLGKENQEEGVQNVTVISTVFTGSENGLRIKTWGRPSNGFVKGVVFEHSIMQDVQNPIIIDQNYCPYDYGCPDQSSGVKISGVTYNDIKGSSATQVAVKFDCSSINPCTNIGMRDIKLTYGGEEAKSSCEHADGSISGVIEPPISCL